MRSTYTKFEVCHRDVQMDEGTDFMEKVMKLGWG